MKKLLITFLIILGTFALYGQADTTYHPDVKIYGADQIILPNSKITTPIIHIDSNMVLRGDTVYQYLSDTTGYRTLVSKYYVPTLEFLADYVSSGAGGIAEAPEDGNTYGRNNASWIIVSAGTGGSDSSLVSTSNQIDLIQDTLYAEQETGKFKNLLLAIGGFFKGDYIEIDSVIFNSGGVINAVDDSETLAYDTIMVGSVMYIKAQKIDTIYSLPDVGSPIKTAVEDSEFDVINAVMLLKTTGVITDDDETPDVSDASILTYGGSANAVVISDLDNPVVGGIYTIIGNSDTYTITINDSGNFNLSANWVGGIDDAITIHVVADNNYIELNRSDN